MVQRNQSKMLARHLNQCIRKINVRFSSDAYHYTRILREEKRDFDLDYDEGGEVMMEPPKPTLTGVEVTQNPEEWKWVEHILPQKVVPPPPKHAQYPTPSGWLPVTANLEKEPYFMRRTRFHNYPIYHEILNGGNRHMTVIKKVQGDIWAMEEDLRTFLEKETGKPMYTQVDEVCCKIRVRGTFLEEVTKYMIKKGF